MKTSIARLVSVSLAAVVLASLVYAPIAEAQRRGGGGGGGGARAGGGERAQAGARADARTSDVRSTSVNNVSAQRSTNVNVNVDCTGRCGGWDHPVAAAAVVGGTIAAIGTAVTAPPPGCVPVNHGGVVYQQCGSTWYAPQGSQYVVVAPPQ